MKRILFILSVLILAGSACAGNGPTTAGDSLIVSQGEVEKSYMLADLQALGAVQEVFREVTYVGVPLSTLLKDAGFDPASLSAVKVIASDGFTVNYDPALFNLPDTMLAYTRADGPLTDTEAPFTMVLPDQEGKLNPRMVVKIIALP